MAKFFNSYTGEWEERDPVQVGGAPAGPTLSSAATKPDDAAGVADQGPTYVKRNGLGMTAAVPAGPALPESAPFTPVGNAGLTGDDVTDKDLPKYIDKATKTVDEKHAREAANGAPPAEPASAPQSLTMPSAPLPPLAAAVASGKKPAGSGGSGGASGPRPDSTTKLLADNIKEQDEAAKATRTAEEAAIGQRQEHARVVAEGAIDAQARALDFQERQQKILSDAQIGIAARTKEMDAAHEQLKQRMAEEGRGYWADKSAGDKVMAGIAMALGGIGAAFQNYGAALQGHQGNAKNLAFDTIMDGIDRENALKAKRVANAKELLGEARAGVTAAKQDREDQLHLLGIEKSAQIETAASALEAKLKAMGATDEEIAGNATLAKLRQTAAEEKQKAITNMASVETQKAHLAIAREELGIKRAELGLKAAAEKAGRGAGKPSEFQLKNQDLGARMIQDEKTLGEVKPMSQEGLAALQKLAARNEFLDRNPAAKAAAVQMGLYKTPDQVLNKNDLQAYQAGARFAASSLRGDSGAAISHQEYASFGQQYLPTLGDSPETLAKKKAARQQLIEGKVRGAADPGALVQQWQGGGQAAPAAAAAPAMNDNDRAAVDWAMRNPNDPRARQIMAMHGK